MTQSAIAVNMLNYKRWRITTILVLGWCCLTYSASGQSASSRLPTLPEDRLKSGSLTLRAFAPVAEASCQSVVKLEVDGKKAALGAVIDADGLVITKASEIKPGLLRCKLASGQEVDAAVIAIDEDNDVALVRTEAACLIPVRWAAGETTLGQWTITQGLEAIPEAVGILSAPVRKILPERAIIGVFLTNLPNAKIVEVASNLGAEKAGLMPGDYILAVNGAPVKNTEELTQALRQIRGGQYVKLRIQREEQEFEVSVLMTVPRLDSPWPGFNRQAPMNRMGGALSRRAQDFQLAFQHDSVLQPWQCGGPLMNLAGEAIGLNIARAGRTASYALPASLVRGIIEELKIQAQKPPHPEATLETSQPMLPK